MTVDEITPCVCKYPGEMRAEIEDDDYMPHLTVRNGLFSHVQFYSAFCPRCGRGSKMDSYKSAYLALKNWNRFQRSLWEMETQGADCLLK